MGDYRLNLNSSGEVGERDKCCVKAHFSDDLTFGNLYTISKNNDDNKEERTYDEPYSGDLPRRSWLCCPGSQDRIEGEQPPLLEASKRSPVSGQDQEAITWPPSRTFCSGICVCLLLFKLQTFGIFN